MGELIKGFFIHTRNAVTRVVKGINRIKLKFAFCCWSSRLIMFVLISSLYKRFTVVGVIQGF